jgi:DNA-binding HxlR family transcriptional regulator
MDYCKDNAPMTQTEFTFEQPKTPPIRLMVLQAMSDGAWWRLEGLAAYCRDTYGKWVSDATISARLRELAAKGIPHETRSRGNGSMAVEYRLTPVASNKPAGE